MKAFRNIMPFVAVLSALFLRTAYAQRDIEGYRPSPSEIVVLPRFCWGEFPGSKFKGPEFKIPYEKCHGMNHYCPGLVLLGRANRSFDDRKRLGNLKRARNQVGYALRALKRVPQCPVREDIIRTYQLIERELSLTR